MLTRESVFVSAAARTNVTEETDFKPRLKTISARLIRATREAASRFKRVYSRETNRRLKTKSFYFGFRAKETTSLTAKQAKQTRKILAPF